MISLRNSTGFELKFASKWEKLKTIKKWAWNSHDRREIAKEKWKKKPVYIRFILSLRKYLEFKLNLFQSDLTVQKHDGLKKSNKRKKNCKRCMKKLLVYDLSFQQEIDGIWT